MASRSAESFPAESQLVEIEKITFPPIIVVVAGLPRTGKSTLANELARRTNLVPLDVDLARYSDSPPRNPEPRGSEKEERTAMALAYQRNHQRAQELLQNDHPVVLNATYSRGVYHKQLKELSDKTGCRIVFFLLETPDDVIRTRLASGLQSGVSNVTTFEQYDAIRDRYEEYPNGVIRIRTDRSIAACVEELVKHITNETAVSSL